MKFKLFPKIIFVFIVSLLFINCDKSEDGIPTDLEIENFVWGGLNAYYLWQSDVPDLSDLRFSNQNQLNSYLEGFSSPENLFDNLLYTAENGYPANEKGYDRFSWIVDDYVALENAFQGITVSNGMDFQLYLENGSTTNVYGVVRYVVPASDAKTQGVLRGMVFSSVDGTQITANNYQNLLFGTNTDYTINLADFNGGNPILNGTSIALSKIQLQEDPVAKVEVFDEGANTIGYLLYNQFASSYDSELNAAFGTFKASGVTDLIVDLRYNGGGSVQTATYLGSMITKQPNTTIYSQQIWNEKVMENNDPSNFLNYFTDRLTNTDENGNVILDEPINSLGLSTVYFIVTEDTASASELVINALSAYIDVKLVGTQTVGKQVGSITLYDSDDYRRNGANLNTNHTYVMQPIVLEIKNANGENNPNGYTAEFQLAEDFGQDSGVINLGVLGDKTEPLLERTIQYITTGARSTGKTITTFNKNKITNSKLQRPFANEMYVDFK
ncbi:S41 family peptidase [Polaribacter sp. AHE13PA]|uniref:S41 family peptidase n=1 Tax=Polaribacter sp. AHE13PA TaxID=2745562 RepID=UPI001C4E3069|nr:S41 family peptidase [Polaribacter sp. AHE13PA]QXP67840.1 peptidase S41 [Polaribacter sp. AHE13PA]